MKICFMYLPEMKTEMEKQKALCLLTVKFIEFVVFKVTLSVCEE